MTSDQTQRLVIRGLLIVLTLLIIALILQLGALVLLIANDDINVNDVETAASFSSLAVIALAVVGVLSVYVKTLNKE